MAKDETAEVNQASRELSRRLRDTDFRARSRGHTLLRWRSDVPVEPIEHLGPNVADVSRCIDDVTFAPVTNQARRLVLARQRTEEFLCLRETNRTIHVA